MGRIRQENADKTVPTSPTCIQMLQQTFASRLALLVCLHKTPLTLALLDVPLVHSPIQPPEFASRNALELKDFSLTPATNSVLFNALIPIMEILLIGSACQAVLKLLPATDLRLEDFALRNVLRLILPLYRPELVCPTAEKGFTEIQQPELVKTVLQNVPHVFHLQTVSLVSQQNTYLMEPVLMNVSWLKTSPTMPMIKPDLVSLPHDAKMDISA